VVQFLTILLVFSVSADHHGAIWWSKLRDILTTEGEILDNGDLNDFLGALIGDVQTQLDPSDIIDGRTFASKILGFEENF
jgi:hypothetical protein